jgi:hypothetical protein
LIRGASFGAENSSARRPGNGGGDQGRTGPARRVGQGQARSTGVSLMEVDPDFPPWTRQDAPGRTSDPDPGPIPWIAFDDPPGSGGEGKGQGALASTYRIVEGHFASGLFLFRP